MTFEEMYKKFEALRDRSEKSLTQIDALIAKLTSNDFTDRLRRLEGWWQTLEGWGNRLAKLETLVVAGPRERAELQVAARLMKLEEHCFVKDPEMKQGVASILDAIRGQKKDDGKFMYDGDEARGANEAFHASLRAQGLNSPTPPWEKMPPIRRQAWAAVVKHVREMVDPLISFTAQPAPKNDKGFTVCGNVACRRSWDSGDTDRFCPRCGGTKLEAASPGWDNGRAVLRDENARLANILADQATTIEKLKKEVAHWKERRDELSQRLESSRPFEFLAQFVEQRGSETVLEAVVRELKDVEREANTENVRLRGEVQHFGSQVGLLQNEIDANKRFVHEANTAAREALNTLQKDREVFLKERDNLNASYKMACRERDNFSKALSTQRQEIDRLTTQVFNLQDVDVYKKQQQEIDNLKADVNVFKSQRDGAQKEKDELAAIRDRLVQERSELRQEINHLKYRQQEHLKTIAELSRTMPFKDEVDELKNQRGVLFAEVATLKSALADERKNLLMYKNDANHLRAQLDGVTVPDSLRDHGKIENWDFVFAGEQRGVGYLRFYVTFADGRKQGYTVDDNLIAGDLYTLGRLINGLETYRAKRFNKEQRLEDTLPRLEKRVEELKLQLDKHHAPSPLSFLSDPNQCPVCTPEENK